MQLKQLITLGLALGLLSCGNDSSPTKPPEPVLPDTTSHEFTWEILNFGDGNASKLHDVCIVDEDNIWAVGEIFVQDSTGQFEKHLYNVVHWNGVEWELKRFQFPVCGTKDTAPFAARAVFAFSNKEVWFTSAGQIIRLKDGATSSFCAPPDWYTEEDASPYGDPSNLGLYKRTTTTPKLRLVVHIVRYDDGSGGISQTDLQTSIQQLNSSFVPAMMAFEIFNRDTIDSDT